MSRSSMKRILVTNATGQIGSELVPKLFPNAHAPNYLAEEIKKHIPEFSISYDPDSRQAIADSWPKTIDDSAAFEERGWELSYDLATMTKDMLKRLRIRLNKIN